LILPPFTEICCWVYTIKHLTSLKLKQIVKQRVLNRAFFTRVKPELWQKCLTRNFFPRLLQVLIGSVTGGLACEQALRGEGMKERKKVRRTFLHRLEL